MNGKKKLTGYPSIDKPWLKYYPEEDTSKPLPECTIYEYLWENNKDHLDGIALNYFGRKITYHELFSNIKKAANGFCALGVKQGDIVIMATVTTPETVYALYGLNMIGAISNMVDPRTSIDGIKTYIEEVEAKFILTIDVALPKIKQAIVGTTVESVIVTSPSDSLPILKKALFQLSSRIKGKANSLSRNCLRWNTMINGGKNTISTTVSYKKDACCVIVHTGGTTGIPKGVMLSNDNLNSSTLQCDLSGFDFQRAHKWLGVMPPFIAYGIGNGLHLPLCKGMTLVVLPKFDPKKYDELLIKYTPNHIAGVPSHYNTIIHSPKMKNRNLSFLYSPIVGGDSTEVGFENDVSGFLQEHKCPTNLIKGYGMTEICAAVTATARKEYNKSGSVGIPFTHSVVAIFNPDSEKEMRYNEIGEVCMRGPHIMLGYYNNEKETNKVLKIHKDGSLWLHSGDLGYMDEDGCLYIQGRIKRMIVRHDGFKVFPTLIEGAIIKHNDIVSCCVVGQKDRQHSQGQLPVVFAVLERKGSREEKEVEKELRRMCQEELPEYAQPVGYMFIDALPLTPIGKVDYRTLEDMA